MESLKNSIKYQLMESKSFIFGFWSVLIVVNIFFLILNSVLNNSISIGFSVGIMDGVDSISIAGINIMAILIAIIVYNYERNYQSFPLAISLSMTRKEYFASFLIDNVFIAFVFATIQGILMKIDPYFVKLIGRNPLYEFGYFNSQTDNLFFIIFIFFITFLGFICFWNLLASINYKIGYKMWLILIGVNMLITFLKIEVFGSIFRFLANLLAPRPGALEILSVLVVMIVAYLLNYLIVSRSDIKKSIG